MLAKIPNMILLLEDFAEKIITRTKCLHFIAIFAVSFIIQKNWGQGCNICVKGNIASHSSEMNDLLKQSGKFSQKRLNFDESRKWKVKHKLRINSRNKINK